MEIITISCTPYKEKDGIVLAFSKEGVINFSVKGIMNPKSPNIILSTPMILADITLQEGNYKYPLVKSSTLIATPYSAKDDIYKFGLLNLLSEAMKVMVLDEEKHILYDFVKDIIISLKKGNTNYLQLTLLFLARVIKVNGYDLEVNRCVYCGSKKDIISFSFEEGGFICKNCLEDGEPSNLTNQQMLLIRTLFLLDNANTQIPTFNEKDGKVILTYLKDFIFEGIGIKLKSINLFED